ncbi:MAG: tetratricopeptide repeat protein [Nitrososphaerales archaeon]
MITKNERRLAAIMFTDMVGYTSLSQTNESLALELLENHRRIVRPLLANHNGLEIKTMGDAFLVEFGSALEAVECSFEIQKVIHDLNPSLPPNHRIALRIGLHVGDVIESNADIFGDAVNIASRIEPLAKPEGICLTRQVYDQIQNKFEARISRMGKIDLKNVKGPLEVYSIVMPWEERQGTDQGKMLDANRIAVLPLVNLSSDPEDEYFSDGLTEELISTISQIQGLRVISRTSVMRFKKTDKSLGEIGQELNVGTVLEGSVRRIGKKLRVTAQLIDVVTDEHEWAKNYDRDLEDVFAIQSDIAQSIADALRIKLLENEKKRIQKATTGNTEAYNLYLKGRFYWNKRNKESLSRALDYFERAVKEDPSFALAYVGIADCLNVQTDHGYVPLKESIPKIKEMARKALEIDENLAEAHASLAAALSSSFEFEASEKEFKRSIALNPSYATAHHWYAIYLSIAGRMDDAIAEAKVACELDPLSPQIVSLLAAIYFKAKRYDEALKQVKQALEIDPNFGVAHLWLASIYSDLERYEEAVAAASRAYNLNPGSPGKTILGYIYAKSGKKEAAAKLAEELIEQSKQEYVPYWAIAVIYSGLGMTDKAIEWLERSQEEREEINLNVLDFSWFDSLRSDPRFEALTRKRLSSQ